MATLTDVQGDWISLEILDYQFPAIVAREENEWDANWLMIRLTASLRGQEWTADAPAFFTWNVQEMAQFLEALAAGSVPRGESLVHAEPEIWFFVRNPTDQPRRLGLSLSHSFRPPTKPGWTPARYVLSVAPEALRSFAAELRAEALRFPIRVPGSPARE